ncbi:MAG: LSU ribosomal protein L23p (L23Ae), partial [uncultured Frankineae bacterium]
ERPDRPPGHPDLAGHLREELRPARREQVHVPRPPGRQQDPDQDRGREGLRREGERRQHAQPPGQAQAHACGLRSARLLQARDRHAARGPHRDLRGPGLL